MSETRLIACIGGCALISGVGLGWLFWPERDRAGEMMSLFETHCVPFAVSETQTAPEGAEQIDLDGAVKWLDHGTGFAVIYGAHDCTVTDVHAPLNKRERQAAELAAIDIMKSRVGDARVTDISDDMQADIFTRAASASNPGANPTLKIMRMMQDSSDPNDKALQLKMIQPGKDDDNA